DQIWLLQLHSVAMRFSQLVQGGPLLTIPADVLSLFLTDRTSRRRLSGFLELHPAGCADVVRHGLPFLEVVLIGNVGAVIMKNLSATAGFQDAGLDLILFAIRVAH